MKERLLREKISEFTLLDTRKTDFPKSGHKFQQRKRDLSLSPASCAPALMLFFTLTLIWVGFLGVRFEVWGEGGKNTPCLKLVRIMLENWNLVGKYTHECSFRK